MPLSAAFIDFVGTREAQGVTRPQFRYPSKGDNMRTRVLTEEERVELIRLFMHEFDMAVSRKRPEGVPCGTCWADLFVFLMDTGVRPSEARALRFRDLKGDRVYVWKTKTTRPRMIPLTERAKEAFLRQCHRLEDDGTVEEPFGRATKDLISWAWR